MFNIPRTPAELESFYLAIDYKIAVSNPGSPTIKALLKYITTLQTDLAATEAALVVAQAEIVKLTPDIYIAIEVDDVAYKLGAKLP